MDTILDLLRFYFLLALLQLFFALIMRHGLLIHMGKYCYVIPVPFFHYCKNCIQYGFVFLSVTVAFYKTLNNPYESDNTNDAE